MAKSGSFARALKGHLTGLVAPAEVNARKIVLFACFTTKLRYVTYLGIFLVVVLLSSDPSWGEVIPDCVSESEIVISRSWHVPILYQRVMEMPVEGFLYVSYILNLSNPPDRDLLPFLQVGLRGGHSDKRAPSPLSSQALVECADDASSPSPQDTSQGRACASRALPAPPGLKSIWFISEFGWPLSHLRWWWSFSPLQYTVRGVIGFRPVDIFEI